MIPKYFFLTEGVGKHKKPLVSFELALRDGGIQQLNLVNVSSIVPAGCKQISKEQGVKMIKPGEITFTVLVKNATNEPHRLTTASIGVAIPSDKDSYGYLAEYHCYGKTAEDSGDYAEKLAASMIDTTGKPPSDAGTSKGEDRSLHTTEELIETTKITGSAKGDERGLWTTVIAAAVFIL